MPDKKDFITNPKDLKKGKGFRAPKHGSRKSGDGKETPPLKPGFPKINDPSFYMKYKELAENAARIAFNHRNGSRLPYRYNIASSNTNRNIDPILVLDYIPVPGPSIDMKSAINISAEATYKVLNRKYRGSQASRYQPADLGIVLFAILDFYISLAQAERAYGLAMEAKLNQRQIPRELLLTLGYNPDSLMHNLADFRAAINLLIIRAQSLCLPKGLTFLEHHMFLVSNVFKDKETLRANYFCYRKPGYWKWTPARFTTGSALTFVDNSYVNGNYLKMNNGPTYYHALQGWEDIIADLEAQLSPLLNDSDIDSICTDILAYFGNENDNPGIVKVSHLPEEYSVSAVYSEDACKQLHNTVIVHSCGMRTSRAVPSISSNIASAYPKAIQPTGDTPVLGLYIFQVDGVIQFNAMSHGSTMSLYDDGTYYVPGHTGNNNSYDPQRVLIDTDVLNPDPAHILEISRQTITGYNETVTISGSNVSHTVYTAYGSFIAACARLFTFYEVGRIVLDSNGDFDDIGAAELFYIETCNVGTYAVFPLSRFDWAPICVSIQYVFGDLDNFISVDRFALAPVHEAALLSELANPVAEVLIKDA